MLKNSPIKLGTIISLTTLVGAELPRVFPLSSNQLLRKVLTQRTITFKKKNIVG